MDAQTIRRIFDPFFTTKFTGRGLGLSALPGIVRQHKGAIQLHSIPGKGTSFTVYFPSAGPEQQAARDVGAKDPRGTGTILVVDDEEIVRSLTRATLERYGYQVLTAVDGPEGIRVFRERSGDIALVILDVAMPGMDGAKTLERMLEIRGDVRVLICSGFGNVDLEMRFAGRKGVAFFPKPYTAVQHQRTENRSSPSPLVSGLRAIYPVNMRASPSAVRAIPFSTSTTLRACLITFVSGPSKVLTR